MAVPPGRAVARAQTQKRVRKRVNERTYERMNDKQIASGHYLFMSLFLLVSCVCFICLLLIVIAVCVLICSLFQFLCSGGGAGDVVVKSGGKFLKSGGKVVEMFSLCCRFYNQKKLP